MAGKQQRYWARRPMGYTDDEAWEHGQVVALRSMGNDEKLLRLGYVRPLDGGAQTFQCAECGKEFIEAGLRTRHGDRAHRPQSALNPLQEDERAVREERFLEQVAPLHLEQTAASRR